MCDYQGYEFGAGSYPDSVCIDGRLYDADNCDGEGNLYEPGEDIPCPMCKPKEAIRYWTDQNRFSGSTVKEATKTACSLVADIRKNRGVTDMTPNAKISGAGTASAGLPGSAAGGRE